MKHEENLSAEQSASEADARVSRSDGDPWWAASAQAASGQGAQAPHGVRSPEAAGVKAERRASWPARARLRKRSEFLRVQRDGERRHTEQFVLLAASGREQESRIGITVSSKVGNAVVRNRLKRLVREVVRGLWRDIEPPRDIVVIAKPNAAETTHAKAATQLRRALGVVEA